MNRLEKVKELFDQMSDLTPQERASFLDATCADDSQLRAEVESLLAVGHEAEGFLEQPLLLELDVEPERRSQIGHVIDRYRLLDEVGQGGMATVYLAERIDGQYHQRVAIKLVWPGVDSGEITRRFKQERQILARLDHPNIARLLDGGATDEGCLYLVMEYIEGEPIMKFCLRRRTSLNERLKLFQTVCAAVAYAHRNLVVHRDIKPSNILVTDDGVVKLLDFGIAKVLDPESGDALAERTRAGLRPMTPEYASPEQFREEPITTASDIYSLGALLYELLTGAPMYDLKTLPLYEITRIICDEDPPPPSTKVARLAELNFRFNDISRERLRRQLRGDLDNIALLALRKDPRQRYQSVEQLSADIGRYLAGETVSARPTTLFYDISKRVKRNKAVVALTVAVFTLLFSFVGYLLNEGFKATRLARDQRRQIYALRLKEAQQFWREGDLSRMDAALTECLPAPGAPPEDDLRDFEWRYLRGLTHPELLTLKNTRADRILDFIVHQEVGGQSRYLLLTYDTDNSEINIRDITTGQKLRSFDLPSGYPNLQMGGGPETKEIYLQENDHVVSIWHINAGRRLESFTDQTAKITAFAAPTSTILLTSHKDGAVKVWDRKTQQVSAVFKNTGRPINYLSVSANSLLMAIDEGQALTIIDWAAGKTLGAISNRQSRLANWLFTRDGRRLVTRHDGEDIEVRDARTLRLISKFRDTANIVTNVVPAPDNRVATWGNDWSIKLWDVETGRPVATFRGHTSYISDIGFLPDGKIMITASYDRTVRFWDIATQRELAIIKGYAQEMKKITLSADGKLLAVGFDNRVVRIWDVATLLHPSPKVFTGHTRQVYSVAVAPDGALVASASEDKTVRLWDIRRGWRATLTGHLYPVWSVAFAPDGRTLASGSYDGTAILWDAPTGQRLATFSHGAGYDLRMRPIAYRFGVRSVAFSPDGRTLATASNDGTVKLWDLTTGHEVGSLLGHKGWVLSVAFSPDGRWIVTGGEDAKARLWDAVALREVRVFSGHQHRVWSAKFSPDGRALATGSRDKTVRLWDPLTGALLREFKDKDDSGGVFCVAFTPDGQRLVTASDDYQIKFWDVARGDEVFTLKEHTNEVWSVAFSSDGSLMVSGSWDKTVRLWRAATESEVKARPRK